MSWYDDYKEEQILVNQDGGHNKFWAAYFDEKTCQAHVRWGRLGTKGQSQAKPFASAYQAANFISTKMGQKLRKGYSDRDQDGNKIDLARFDLMCVEAAIVGSQNKCHGMNWVEVTCEDPMAWHKIEEDRLFAPDCNPGMLVKFETRKKYDGCDSFTLLFTFDKAYELHGGVGTQIGPTHPLAEMVGKVEEALGRRLSAA